MSEGYEKKDVSVKGVVLGAVAIVVLIVTFIVMLRGYFVLNYEKDITQEIKNNPPQELQEILKKDHTLLSNYDILDKKKGVYQIPIDRAMDLVVRDYQKRQ